MSENLPHIERDQIRQIKNSELCSLCHMYDTAIKDKGTEFMLTDPEGFAELNSPLIMLTEEVERRGIPWERVERAKPIERIESFDAPFAEKKPKVNPLVIATISVAVVVCGLIVSGLVHMVRMNSPLSGAHITKQQPTQRLLLTVEKGKTLADKQQALIVLSRVQPLTDEIMDVILAAAGDSESPLFRSGVDAVIEICERSADYHEDMAMLIPTLLQDSTEWIAGFDGTVDPTTRSKDPERESLALLLQLEPDNAHIYKQLIEVMQYYEGSEELKFFVDFFEGAVSQYPKIGKFILERLVLQVIKLQEEQGHAVDQTAFYDSIAYVYGKAHIDLIPYIDRLLNHPNERIKWDIGLKAVLYKCENAVYHGVDRKEYNRLIELLPSLTQLLESEEKVRELDPSAVTHEEKIKTALESIRSLA